MIRFLLALALLLPVRLTSAADEDHVAQKADLRVVHAWSPATDAGDGAVFMDIESLGGEGDLLTGAASEMAGRVEIHGAVLEGGEPASRPMEAIEIPAGGEFVLEPGAVFLKLLKLRRPLAEGDEFPVRLTFARAGELDVRVEVEAADATQHGHAGHAH